MKGALYSMAQTDTPEVIKIPPGWSGIIIWAVGRFGVGVIVAGVFGYAALRVYQDDHALIERVMTAFEARAKVDSSQADAARQLSEVLSRLVLEVRDAHTRASGKNDGE